ncbi:MAG: DUF4157 domain-containing protein, partial [Treponema sp.]|nr:DUF4157 domain-containing protein [Treponema sp.]
MNKMLSIIRNFIQAINFFEEKSVLYRDNFIESSKKEPSLADYNRGETMVERVLFRDRKHPVDRVIINDFNRKNGADLGEVTIVYGPAADEYTRSHHALALVLGTDIFFRNGAYRPETEEGRKILAHELTHVAQNKECKLDDNRTREELEREAEAAEKQVEDSGDPLITRRIGGREYKLRKSVWKVIDERTKEKLEEKIESLERVMSEE